eukprot:m.190377 g.190377  ORF g.190377 m.190377 type:complete len:407 (+) comp18229_c0_seq1:167-1387(+)
MADNEAKGAEKLRKQAEKEAKRVAKEQQKAEAKAKKEEARAVKRQESLRKKELRKSSRRKSKSKSSSSSLDSELSPRPSASSTSSGLGSFTEADTSASAASASTALHPIAERRASNVSVEFDVNGKKLPLPSYLDAIKQAQPDEVPSSPVQSAPDTDERLKVAREASAAALNEFAFATGKAGEAAAENEGDRPVRGVPAGINLGGKRGLPTGLMFDDDEQGDEDGDGDEHEEEGDAADQEGDGAMSFEQIMNAAMEIEEQEGTAGDAPQQASKSEQDAPPEDWEIWRALSDSDAEELEVLIELGGNVNCRNRDGYTPLHKCADDDNEEMLAAFIKVGADLNAQTEDQKWTALHIAALSGLPNLVKLLLEAGADTSVRDSRDETALQWAEANSEDACVELLKQHGAT